jgi:hypothetical protein
MVRFDSVASRSIGIAMLGFVVGMALYMWPARASQRAPGDVTPAASTATGGVPASFARDPLAFYFDERYQDGLRYGNAVLTDAAASPEQRRNVLVAVGTIELALRRPDAARATFLRMLAEDPTIELDRPERLPPPVTRLFYRLRDSICTAEMATLLVNRKLGADIRTIAVGDIENNSLVRTSYDTDHLARGLVHVIINDLRGATGLKVVDRQRLATLLDEIGHAKDEELTDPSTRVRVGQLSGAQSYMFGQFMQIARDQARMDLRWVNTATGEILLSEGVQSKIGTADDLFKLERKILVDVMAPRIQRMLDSTQAPTELQKRIQRFMDERRRVMPGKSYTAWVEASGHAVASEDAGNYTAAITAWRDAARHNRADSIAVIRARTLSAYQKAARD